MWHWCIVDFADRADRNQCRRLFAIQRLWHYPRWGKELPISVVFKPTATGARSSQSGDHRQWRCQPSRYPARWYWKLEGPSGGPQSPKDFLGDICAHPKIKERSGPEGHRAPEQPSPRTAQNETTSGPKSSKYNFPATPWHRCARRSSCGPQSSRPCANFCTCGGLLNAPICP
jgi:hypothetical protein